MRWIFLIAFAVAVTAEGQATRPTTLPADQLLKQTEGLRSSLWSAKAAADDAVAAATRAFNNSEGGKRLQASIDSAERRKNESQTPEERIDRSRALLAAKTELAKAKANHVELDERVVTARASIGSAADALRPFEMELRARSAAELRAKVEREAAIKAAEQKEIDDVEDQVRKGTKVSTIIKVLGEPDRVTKRDDGAAEYLWVVKKTVVDKAALSDFRAADISQQDVGISSPRSALPTKTIVVRTVPY